LTGCGGSEIVMNNIMNINFIDIFAGAGGMSEGFIREGFSTCCFC
jgi:site-specific DNA-cytosine methylase